MRFISKVSSALDPGASMICASAAAGIQFFLISGADGTLKPPMMNWASSQACCSEVNGDGFPFLCRCRSAAHRYRRLLELRCVWRRGRCRWICFSQNSAIERALFRCVMIRRGVCWATYELDGRRNVDTLPRSFGFRVARLLRDSFCNCL